MAMIRFTAWANEEIVFRGSKLHCGDKFPKRDLINIAFENSDHLFFEKMEFYRNDRDALILSCYDSNNDEIIMVKAEFLW